MQAAPYLLSPVVLLVTGTGFWWGGGYAWLGAAAFVLIALCDAVLPADHRPRRIARPAALRLLLYLHYPILLGVWFALAASLGAGRIGGLEVLGAVLSLGLIVGGIGLPTAHELMHGKRLVAHLFANLIGVTYGVPLTDLAHVHVHHIHVGTPADGDTPRRGEDVYRFSARSIWDQLRITLGMEAAHLRRAGRSIWSPRGRLLWGVLAQGLFAVAFCAMAGWVGVPVLIAGWLLAYLVMADYNYVQHYGLVRVPGQPIEARHAWNHLKPLSRLATFEITTHSEHHLDPDRPFERLTPMPQAPQAPAVWWCFLVSFVPPLWRRLMRPRLADWDRRYASPAERELALAANRAAGGRSACA